MFSANTKEDINNLKGSAQNIADNSKDDLRYAAKNAGRKVRGFFNSATDELSHATDTVTSQIRTKPVQSSLIALSAGFILGALFRR